jgi:ligand-binding SRPBCC domain-containing protein
VTRIEATNVIGAPIASCFRLSLDIDVELRAAADYGLRAIGGVTSGVIGAGERVSWRAKQFGVWVKHTTEITGYEAPVYFQDSMVKGLFRSFQHDHFFRSLGPSETEMRDELRFSMPAFLLGLIAERVLVRRRIKELLVKRNELIRRYAEGERAGSGGLC